MLAETMTRALSRLGLDRRGGDLQPRQPAPMLLSMAETLFPSDAWTYEPKWDGFRVLAAVREGSVRLLSRNGHTFTKLFAPVSEALRGFPVSLILDGEVIAINDRGRSDFEALQARLRPGAAEPRSHLCYMVFDCLYVNGHSLMSRPLEQRRSALQTLHAVLRADAVKLTEGFAAEKSERLLTACASMGLEGVVMKKKGSLYRPGYRTPDWLKIPLRQAEEFVVAGYVPGPRGFSTLVLGQHDRQGKLIYAGFCGTGLSDDARAFVLESLKGAHRKTCPFPTVPILRDGFTGPRDTPAQWVRPGLVVEVEYRQRLEDGLRHAVIKGLRPEKTPRTIRRALRERHPD